MSRLWVSVIATCTATLAQADTVQTLSYTCDRDARIDATYVNAGDAAYAVLTVEGHQVALQSERSASGARYGVADSAGYVWHTKGAEASLFWREGDDDKLLARCLERAQ